jgi:hypothetical protein
LDVVTGELGDRVDVLENLDRAGPLGRDRETLMLSAVAGSKRRRSGGCIRSGRPTVSRPK